ISFRASSPSVDRHGTIVRPEGIRTEKFAANPLFVWSHDSYGSMFGSPSLDSIIGRVVSWRASRDSFDIVAEFAPASVNPKAEQAFQLVKGGDLQAVSIGFIPISFHDEMI